MPVVRRQGNHHHHNNTVVVRRPVVVRPPPVGAAVARAVVVGATVGLMASAMGRRGRSQHQVQGSTIVVIQPFPGILVAVHEEHNAIAFVTIPVTEPIPEGAHLVYRPGQQGTSVQVQHHGEVKFAVIPPGQQFPANSKQIKVELAPGTLVQINQPDGQVIQQVIPAPQQIPEGSVVLQRPDGKPPPGTLVQINHHGRTIQQIIYPGQVVPAGAIVIATGPAPPVSHGHHSSKAVEAPPAQPAPPAAAVYAAPPGEASGLYSVDSNGENRAADMPAPPGGVSLIVEPAPASGGLYAFDNSMAPPPVEVVLDKEEARSSMYQPPLGPATGAPYAAPYAPAQPAYVPAAQPYAPAPAYAAPPAYAAAPAPASAPAHSHSSSQNRQSQSPPAWVPDAQAPACMKCRAAFTVTNRRHHCRNCGKVFCNTCAHAPLVLSQYNFREPVRVCNDCYSQITNTQPPPPTGGGCSIM